MKDPVTVDLLQASSERTARKKTAIIAVFFALLVGVLATIGAAASYRAATKGTSVFAEVIDLPGISEIRQFVSKDSDPLSGSDQKQEGQINFLLLGVGGKGHDGPQLSDTIILGSYDKEQNRVSMMSIPRDLAYPLGNGRFEKINSLNAWMEKSYPGQGAKRTATAIGELLNIKIDHVIRIDFDGFGKFIDALGGLEIDVQKSFTDNSYPRGEDEGWKTVSFQKGPTTMNGDRALEFVRSRHGNNGEGSDFARSRRQQQVIQAVREKLFSLGTLSNPKKISELITILSGNIQTDLSSWDMIAYAPLVSQVDKDKITMRVLTDAPDGELVPANVGGAYMLFPRKPDWSEIRYLANNPFSTKEDEEKTLKPETSISLEIKNGTTYEGYAFQVSQKLKKIGYTVPTIGNADHKGYERTMLYDLTDGKKSAELVRLKKMLDADISMSAPLMKDNKRVVYGQYMATETINSTSTDFLVVLGESSLGLINPSYESPTNP